MLDSGGDCRFITLTIKHSDSPLVVQIGRLISSFKLLRKHPAIAAKLTGGAWFLEVKLSKDKARWHPHLHVIAEGHSIPQSLLSRCWLEVTGDSFMVDISAINDPAQRARYVTKYATKPLHNEVTLIPAKLDEFVTAIKGKRLYQCFGLWSKAIKRNQQQKRGVEVLGSLDSIHARAVAGNISDLVLMHQAHARWPALRKSHPLPGVPPGPDNSHGEHFP